MACRHRRLIAGHHNRTLNLRVDPAGKRLNAGADRRSHPLRSRPAFTTTSASGQARHSAAILSAAASPSTTTTGAASGLFRHAQRPLQQPFPSPARASCFASPSRRRSRLPPAQSPRNASTRLTARTAPADIWTPHPARSAPPPPPRDIRREAPIRPTRHRLHLGHNRQRDRLRPIARPGPSPPAQTRVRSKPPPSAPISPPPPQSAGCSCAATPAAPGSAAPIGSTPEPAASRSCS